MHCGENVACITIVVTCDVGSEVYTQGYYIMPMCVHHFSELGKGYTLELSKEAILVSLGPHKRCIEKVG